MSRTTIERRRERRETPASNHLSWWERAERHDPHIAEVLDSSRSGVALLVASDSNPRHGDAIRLTRGPANDCRCARVVRVSPHDDGHVRLGCRWISAREHARADAPSSRRPARARLLSRAA